MRVKNSIIFRCIAVMLVVLLGFPTVYGASVNDSSSSSAVKLLNALDIMQNDEYTGNFWDDTPVKRSEMAKIICKIFNLEEKTQDIPVFDDVRDSDRAVVETAVANGYMNGYGDGNFGADDYITANQLVKTFVCFLNAGTVAEATGGYPNGYLYIAKKTGIYKNISVTGETAARRIDVANMIYNTMHADILQLKEISDGAAVYDTQKGETFLTETLKIYSDSGILNQNSVTSLSKVEGLGTNQIKIGDNVYNDPNLLSDDYLGCSVTVYYSKPDDAVGSVVYIEENSSNKTLVIDDENITSVSDSVVTYYENDSKQKSVNISAVADMIYNGSAVEFDAKLMKVKNGSIKLISNNGTGTYNVVCVDEYDTYVADKANTKDEKITFRHGYPTLDLSETTYRVFRNGEAAELGDIQNGDVLLAAVSKGKGRESAVKIYASSNSAMGTAEIVKANGTKTYVTVGGIEYEMSDYCTKLQKDGKIKTLAPGDAGSFMLDSRGKIVFYSINAGGNGVGYLIESAVQNYGFGSEISTKVYTDGGKIEVFTTGDKVKINDAKYEVADVVKNSEILSKFNTPQLIKYDAADGELKEIVFANDGYSSTEFSKDYNGSLSVSTATVLNHIYCVSSDTKVFVVPTPVTADKAYYGMYTGTYFVRDTSHTGELYEVGSDNMVGYAVVKRDTTSKDLKYNDPVMLVSGITETLNSDGMIVKAVDGWDENGKNVTYVLANQEDAASVASGDVIHYSLNFANEISEITVVKNQSSKYALSTLKSTTVTVYGEVGTLASNRIMIANKPITDDMTPIDMTKSVTNNGSAVYKYISAENKIQKIEFSDIERGDKVFACVEGSNKTRLLVVYR